jgi:hypothetical protein
MTRASALGVLIFSCLPACTTVNHTVRISAVGLDTPVSASGHFISSKGMRLSPTDYAVAEHFKFENELSSSTLVNGDDTLDLKAVLAPVIQKNHADAVVNLLLYGVKYTSGGYAFAGVARNVGVMLGLVAGLLYVGGAVGSSYSDSGNSLQGPAIGVGAGALGTIALSFLIQGLSTSTWTVGGEGDAVKLKP